MKIFSFFCGNLIICEEGRIDPNRSATFFKVKRNRSINILNFISNFFESFSATQAIACSRHYGKSRGQQWIGKSRQSTLVSWFMARLATAAEKRCWNRLTHCGADRDACRMKKKMESRILKQIVTFNNSIFVVWGGFFFYTEKVVPSSWKFKLSCTLGYLFIWRTVLHTS